MRASNVKDSTERESPRWTSATSGGLYVVAFEAKTYLIGIENDLSSALSWLFMSQSPTVIYLWLSGKSRKVGYCAPIPTESALFKH